MSVLNRNEKWRLGSLHRAFTTSPQNGVLYFRIYIYIPGVALPPSRPRRQTATLCGQRQFHYGTRHAKKPIQIHQYIYTPLYIHRYIHFIQILTKHSRGKRKEKIVTTVKIKYIYLYI